MVWAKDTQNIYLSVFQEFESQFNYQIYYYYYYPILLTIEIKGKQPIKEHILITALKQCWMVSSCQTPPLYEYYRILRDFLLQSSYLVLLSKHNVINNLFHLTVLIYIIWLIDRYILSTYEPFKHLMTRAADMFVSKFISKERSLRDYRREIDKLYKMAADIAKLPVHIPMHFFLLDCNQLNEVIQI